LKLRDTETSQFEATLEPVVTWSAVLIFGPMTLWMPVILDIFDYGRRWSRETSILERSETLRNFLNNLAVTTVLSLFALTIYRNLGGGFPIAGLTFSAVLPAIYATLLHLLLQLLIYLPLLIYIGSGSSVGFARQTGWMNALTWGLIIMLFATALAELYAIFAAGLYTQNGVIVYAFFLFGCLIVSWLAYKFSVALERGSQRSYELEKLEQLGRAILVAPPDASTLPDLLVAFVPAMFPRSQIEIRLFPDQDLFHHPQNWQPIKDQTWQWLRDNPAANSWEPKSTLPWDGTVDQLGAIAMAPISDPEEQGNARPTAIGGIYIRRSRDPFDIESLLPALQSLSAQIASALKRADVYRIEKDLAVAGQIQASFLPSSLPEIPGWDIAASLVPARVTSGDFYDVFPLPNGFWGILVADVADKGTGAALYMAMSRTLFRTYAVEHLTNPALVFEAVNRRILTDASSDLFVTVFYGVLDPITGNLNYCNAGHNPPLLLESHTKGDLIELSKTGMPLGIKEDASWEAHSHQIVHASMLVLYTDGITEAQNASGEFFDEERLINFIRDSGWASAQLVLGRLHGTVNEFIGDAPGGQQDDITLVVLSRHELNNK